MAGNDCLSLVRLEKRNGSAHFESAECVCVALFFFIGLWQPLADYADEQQQRAAQSQTLADWITANRQALVQSGQTKPGSLQTVRSRAPTIAQITQCSSIWYTLSRLQPESDGSVSVAVEQQPFNSLAQWLAGIENEQG